jgi:hypothetical protein
MKNHNKPWTLADTIRLGQLVDAGVSIKRVSTLLERSPGACVSRLPMARMIKMAMQGGNDNETLVSWKKKRYQDKGA